MRVPGMHVCISELGGRNKGRSTEHLFHWLFFTLFGQPPIVSSLLVGKQPSRVCLELFFCPLMLIDLGEGTRESGVSPADHCPSHLAGGSSGHHSHEHSFDNFVSVSLCHLLGNQKSTLTLSYVMEGSDRKNTWAYSGKFLF